MEEKVTEIWQEWEAVQAYQQSLGLPDMMRQCVEYYEGRQWAAPTKDTRLLPRPVFNICAMIADNKKAQILNAPIKLVYSAFGEDEKAEAFTRFAEYKLKQIRFAQICDEALDDGKQKGTYVFHHYWDSTVNGHGRYKGDWKVEVIDPLNIGVSNPQETDIQKQEWIIILSRLPVKTVKEICEDKSILGLIEPDNHDYIYEGTKEQKDSELCSVLTKYFRQDGEVYVQKSTKNVVLTDPIPLNPLAIMKADKADAQIDELPDRAEEGAREYKATLYPVDICQWKRREGSIYGISEIETLIPTQKSINWQIAMMLYNTQQMAWGKWVVKDGALRGQEITNEPAQVLTDYTQGMDGIKKVVEQPLSTMPLTLVEKILEITRAVTGATEVMTGEVIGANMSGTAIAQLQNQAAIPLRTARERFLRSMERQGRIMEQFFRLYYDDEPYTYEVIDQTGNVTDTGIFNGSDYDDIELDLVVEAGAGTQWTESLQIQLIDNLLQKGLISSETYIKAMPKSLLPNKDVVLQAIKSQDQNTQLQLQQAMQIIQEQQKAVDNVQQIINKNRALEEKLATVMAAYLETVQGLKTSAAVSQAQGQALNEVVGDAQIMAQILGGQNEVSKMQNGNGIQANRGQG